MRYCLLVLSSLFLFAACSKVDVPQSRQEQVRGVRWQVSEIRKTIRLNDAKYYTDTLRVESLDECKKDDYLEFGANNEGFLKINTVKCGGEQNDLGIRWGIADNDTRMYIYNAGSMFDGNQDVSGKLLNYNSNGFDIEYLVVSNASFQRVDTVYYTAKIKRY